MKATVLSGSYVYTSEIKTESNLKKELAHIFLLVECLYDRTVEHFVRLAKFYVQCFLS